MSVEESINTYKDLKMRNPDIWVRRANEITSSSQQEVVELEERMLKDLAQLIK